MKKQVDVVMLPTEKATNIINDRGNLEFIPNKQIASTINSTVKGFHLYFLSDDEIKEICWCYDTINKEIVLFQGALPKYHYRGYKKIIATTNTDLDKLCGCGNNCGAKPSNLPRPSNEFLKKFCELGGIDKVLVEYEVDTIKSACTCEDSESTSNCPFSYYDGTDECCRKRFPNGEYWDKTYKLKVAPDNTITIYPIE